VFDGSGEADRLLASCYQVALSIAADHQLASIAFPAISTGVYRFPGARAARIAVSTVISELNRSRRSLARVVYCCFSPEAAEYHRRAFAELGLGKPQAS
jgi:O-acetyl-ADP-ribose deacetylase (regulator of RNase III)